MVVWLRGCVVLFGTVMVVLQHESGYVKTMHFFAPREATAHEIVVQQAMARKVETQSYRSRNYRT